MTERTAAIISEKKSLIDRLSAEGYFDLTEEAGAAMAACLKNGGKILTAGNGGSAADAQHFSGEIVGRFLKERGPLKAVTMTVDPSVFTAIANDYGYDHAVERQVEGLGDPGDAVLLISTSGNSENMYLAALKAKEKNMTVVGLLGRDGGKMKAVCDYPLVVTDRLTPRIQEIHTFTVHLLCQLIEDDIFPER